VVVAGCSGASVVTVTRSETTSIGRVARWLLLVGTLLGLAAMHTLGHCGMRMDTHQAIGMIGRAPVMSAAAAPPWLTAAGAAAVPACADGHCDDHGAICGWSICLAVLGGLAVFALLAALLVAWRRERGWVRGTRSSVAGGPQAPPRRRPGLILASAAVLRI